MVLFPFCHAGFDPASRVFVVNLITNWIPAFARLAKAMAKRAGMTVLNKKNDIY